MQEVGFSFSLFFFILQSKANILLFVLCAEECPGGPGSVSPWRSMLSVVFLGWERGLGGNGGVASSATN